MYWNTFGRSRTRYWDNLAVYVNNNCGSRYTGVQCKRKFNGLVTEYNVSIINYI